MSLDNPPPLADRPGFPAGSESLREKLDAILRATPTHALLGIDLTAWGPGWAQLTMSAGPGTGNLVGSVHGGVVFTLADAALEVAVNAYGRLAVTLESTCHYHRPAEVGREMTADAWEVSRGNRTASYRLAVTQGNVVIASYLALAYRTSRWHVDQGLVPESWR